MPLPGPALEPTSRTVRQPDGRERIRVGFRPLFGIDLRGSPNGRGSPTGIPAGGGAWNSSATRGITRIQLTSIRPGDFCSRSSMGRLVNRQFQGICLEPQRRWRSGVASAQSCSLAAQVRTVNGSSAPRSLRRGCDRITSLAARTSTDAHLSLALGSEPRNTVAKTQSMAVLVAAKLLEIRRKTSKQMGMMNALCRFVEIAKEQQLCTRS